MGKISKILYSVLVCITVPACAESGGAVTLQTALGYETWDLPGDESMGMVRLGLSTGISPNLFGGVDLYGAVDGKRGGFFTFGFNGGWQSDPFGPIRVKAGLFAGAGGGGSAPQGGGLMLRPYLEALWRLKNFSLGAGVSHVEFPSGEISSTQMYGTLYIPMKARFTGGWPLGTGYDAGEAEEGRLWDFMVMAGRYLVSDESLTTGGRALEDMDWIGIEAHRYFDRRFYMGLSFSGAGGGDADGYMDLFVGPGFETALGNTPLFVSLQGALGMGGGGRVDTGGGAMWRIKGGIGIGLTDRFRAGIEGGRLESFGGTFAADTLGAYLSYRSEWGGRGQGFGPALWSVRGIEKTHFSGKGDFKDPDRSDRIDMTGIAIDHYLTPRWYVTGQSLWAFAGGAGGYTEGLVGVGARYELGDELGIWAETLLGVGGGGGVQTSDGVLGVFSAGVAKGLTDSVDVLIGGGYTGCSGGGLSTVDGTVQLRYRFETTRKIR